MELCWLEDFLALAATRNFTRAAAQRATTQPAFSRRLRRLEEWLGCDLVDREARPATLTAEGQAFYPRALRLREDILDARRIVQATASHYTAPIRLYTTNTLAIGLVPDLIRVAGLENYSLIVASTTACLEALRAGRATSALLPLFQNEAPPPGFTSSVAGHDRLVLMARPDIAAQIKVEDQAIHGPMLMFSPKTAYGSEVSALLASRKIRLATQPLCESASAEALVAQARAGLGAAWIPESLATPDLTPCLAQHFLVCPYDIILLTPLPEDTTEEKQDPPRESA